MHKTIKATRIFTGDEWLPAHTVVVENGIIQSLQPTANIGDGDGSFLAPAFIDAQVYGAAGKLFSAVIFWKLFGFRKGLLGGMFSFVEEFMPGLDFIPTFTINWLLLYFKKAKNPLAVRPLVR